LSGDDESGRGGGGVAGDLAAEDGAVLEGHGVDCESDSGRDGEIAIEIEGIFDAVVVRLISIHRIEKKHAVFVIRGLLVSMKPLEFVSSWAVVRQARKRIRITGFLI